jgi:hypothetical protein
MAADTAADDTNTTARPAPASTAPAGTRRLGLALPLIVFAAAAGLIFVPLTMTLVAGISDEHAGVASSMFNAGQQVGGPMIVTSASRTSATATSRPPPRQHRTHRFGRGRAGVRWPHAAL